MNKLKRRNHNLLLQLTFLPQLTPSNQMKVNKQKLLSVELINQKLKVLFIRLMNISKDLKDLYLLKNKKNLISSAIFSKENLNLFLSLATVNTNKSQLFSKLKKVMSLSISFKKRNLRNLVMLDILSQHKMLTLVLSEVLLIALSNLLQHLDSSLPSQKVLSKKQHLDRIKCLREKH